MAARPFTVDAGSFRDRDGRVYRQDQRIIRGVSEGALEAFAHVEYEVLATGLVAQENVVLARPLLGFPGGGVDDSESLKNAVTRELKEETSMQVISSEFLFDRTIIMPEPGAKPYQIHYFKCNVTGEVHLNSESDNFAWVISDDLKKYQIAFGNDEVLKEFWQIQ